MADTLKRIFGPQNIANGTSTLFTGTAAHTYSFRGIVIVNNTAGSITVKLGIGGVTDALLFLVETVLATKTQIEFDGLLVTAGTETIQANATATGLTITASGIDTT